MKPILNELGVVRLSPGISVTSRVATIPITSRKTLFSALETHEAFIDAEHTLDIIKVDYEIQGNN